MSKLLAKIFIFFGLIYFQATTCNLERNHKENEGLSPELIRVLTKERYFSIGDRGGLSIAEKIAFLERLIEKIGRNKKRDKLPLPRINNECALKQKQAICSLKVWLGNLFHFNCPKF